MKYSIFSDRGKERKTNEDDYLVNNSPPYIFAVADGMGGHNAGEVASKIAVDYLSKNPLKNKTNILSEINTLIQEINNKIIDMSIKNPEWNDMGTTLSLGIIKNNTLYIGHVGDSRIYIYSDQQLKQLTTDHSLVEEMVEKGEITPQEAFSHPQKNILTQALGIDKNLNIQVKNYSLSSNDLLLFCTDGLSDLVPQSIMKDIIEKNYPEHKKITNVLGEEALSRGGRDNITIISCLIP